MRWAILEFANYSGDDAMFENYGGEEFEVIEAETLNDVIHRAESWQPTRVGARSGLTRPFSLARIDDGDSPYGGVFTDSRYAGGRRYWALADDIRSNLLCYAIFAEPVLGRKFDSMKANES